MTVTDNLKFKPNYSISNTIEFTEKVKDIKINNTDNLVLSNVSNLFTSAPVNESVILINESFRNSDVTNEDFENINNLLSLSLKQKFFSCNNQFFDN